MEREHLASTQVEALPFWPPTVDPAELRSLLLERSPVRGLDIQFRGEGGELQRGLLSSSLSRIEGSPC